MLKCPCACSYYYQNVRLWELHLLNVLVDIILIRILLRLWKLSFISLPHSRQVNMLQISSSNVDSLILCTCAKTIFNANVNADKITTYLICYSTLYYKTKCYLQMLYLPSFWDNSHSYFKVRSHFRLVLNGVCLCNLKKKWRKLSR